MRGSAAAPAPVRAMSGIAGVDGCAETGSVHSPARLRLVRDAGMASAEYAVALIAACAFAAVLLVAIQQGAVLGAIAKLISAALKVIS